MKNLIFILSLLCFNALAQDKYLTRMGVVDFEASVPTFEEVKAKNNSVTAILNTETGEFAALVLIKGFRFKNALMEEHFNENYAESDQYPKATFKGTIQNFEIIKLSATPTKFILNGDLSFHRRIKKISYLNIEITRNETSIIVKGKFVADASDFNIKVPKIVRNKISKDINVSFEFILKKKPSN